MRNSIILKVINQKAKSKRQYAKVKNILAQSKICHWVFAFCRLHFAFRLFLPFLHKITSVASKDAASSPRNLIVCGNETNVTVRITNNTLNASTLSNISAQIQLFKGVQLITFIPSQS